MRMTRAVAIAIALTAVVIGGHAAAQVYEGSYGLTAASNEVPWSGWGAISLAPNWSARSGTGTTLPPIGCGKYGRAVVCQGEVNAPAILAGNLTVATMPAPIRPSYEYAFPLGGQALVGTGQLRVKPSGNIDVEGITAAGTVNFNTITYLREP